MKDDNCQLCETLDESWERERETWNCDETRRCSVVFTMTRQKVTSYFDKSRGSLLITGAHCDIQPSGIQGFNIIDTQQRGQHPRLLKESLSIECRTLLLYPFLKHSKLGEVPTVFRKRWPSLGMKNFLSPINGITVNGITAPVWRKYYIWREKGNIFFFFLGQFDHPNTYVEEESSRNLRKDKNKVDAVKKIFQKATSSRGKYISSLCQLRLSLYIVHRYDSY